MSALAVTTTPIRPAAPRSTAPDCSRPRLVRHQVRGSVTSCRVEPSSSEPAVRLTRRGVAVAMSTIGLVMGSAVVTVITAFLSVSNAPL